MKLVSFHSQAREELDAAMAWYEGQKPGLGLELQTEVERNVTLIRQHPKIGTPYKRTTLRYSVLRKFPFVLYYAVLTDTIWIAAVAHGRRRPGYWRGRKPE